MGGKIADNPNRIKVCRGCGKGLRATDYYATSDGYPQSRCKPCHREVTRRSQRKARENSEYRAREAERKKARYYADHERAIARLKERYERVKDDADYMSRRYAVKRVWYAKSKLLRQPFDRGDMGSGSMVRVCNCHGKVTRIRLDDDTVRCAFTGRRLSRFKVAAA